MSSPIASSPYVCRTPTDILKCALHMPREKSISTVISHVDPKKRSLLLWNSYSSAGQHVEKTTQPVNIYINKILSNIVIHSANKTICGFWNLKKDKELFLFVLTSSQKSIAQGCESLLLTHFIVSY